MSTQVDPAGNADTYSAVTSIPSQSCALVAIPYLGLFSEFKARHLEHAAFSSRLHCGSFMEFATGLGKGLTGLRPESVAGREGDTA